MSYYRYLATSTDPFPRFVRRARRWWHGFTLPAPRIVVVPMLWIYLALRRCWHTFLRLFICEPLFKAYCTSYGSNVRTGIYVPWVIGRGEIILGSNVEVRGSCFFAFAARFVDSPKLIVGSNTNIGHDCGFTIGKQIKIGNNCLIAGEVFMFDSGGHPADPAGRLANLPPSSDEVRPITIGDNVWIGQRCMIAPGVTIGDNSIVSVGSVVVSDVPPNVIVAGYPARKIGSLQPPGAAPLEPAVAPRLQANA